MSDEIQDLKSIVVSHDTEIKTIKQNLNSLGHEISESRKETSDNFNRLYTRLEQHSKFPVANVIALISVGVLIISLLAGGYVGKPLARHNKQILATEEVVNNNNKNISAMSSTIIDNTLEISNIRKWQEKDLYRSGVIDEKLKELEKDVND